MGKKILEKHGDNCNCSACQHKREIKSINSKILNRKTIERLKKEGMGIQKKYYSNEQEIEDADRKLSDQLYATEDVVHALERIERLLEELIRFEEKKETY